MNLQWECPGCGKQTKSFYDVMDEKGIAASCAACPTCMKSIKKLAGADVWFEYYNREVKPTSRRDFIMRLALKK
jgi:uncharacterized Zn finger protein